MEIIYLLIPLSIILVSIVVGVFLWSVKTEQFDNLEGEGHRILFDEEAPLASKTRKPESANPIKDTGNSL